MEVLGFSMKAYCIPIPIIQVWKTQQKAIASECGWHAGPHWCPSDPGPGVATDVYAKTIKLGKYGLNLLSNTGAAQIVILVLCNINEASVASALSHCDAAMSDITESKSRDLPSNGTA